MRNSYINIPAPAFYLGEKHLLRDMPDSFILEPYIRKGELSMIVSAPDIGKSTLIKQLCISISAGLDEFCGLKLRSDGGRAILVTTEEEPSRVINSINKMAYSMGVNPVDIKYDIVIVPMSAPFLDESMKANLEDFNELISLLKQVLDSAKYDFVAIDALHDLFDLANIDSNKQDVRKPMGTLQKLAQDYEVAITLVHHITKAGHKEKPDQVLAAGSGGVTQKVRSVLYLGGNNTQSYRALFCVKGNFVAPEYKINGIGMELGKHFTADGNSYTIDEFLEKINSASELSQSPTKEATGKYTREYWVNIFGQNTELANKDICKLMGLLPKFSISACRSAVKKGLLEEVSDKVFRLK